MNAEQPLRCEAHQAETRLTCAQCATPICTQCMVRTDVGLRCRQCAAPAAVPAGGRPQRRLAVGLGLAGIALLGVVGAVVAVAVFGEDQEIVVAEEVVGEWSEASSLNEVRGETSAVTLDDGRVMVVGGGLGDRALPAVELFDPDAGGWTGTGALAQARRGHTAVVLDDGRVLVAGGLAGGQVLDSAEVFDPADGSWESAGEMTQPRLGHTMTVLGDGRVLVAGGAGGDTGDVEVQAQVIPGDTAEVYDPQAGEWSAVGDLIASRFDHTATVLGDGRVLLAGGLTLGEDAVHPTESAELYDPSAESFSRSSSMQSSRADHAAVALADGRVLVVGGDRGNRTTGAAEIFDFDRGAWSGAASLERARRGHAASLLGDGSVLVSGGESVQDGTRTSLADAERYAVDDDSWTQAGEMECPRSRHGQALLADGSVLAVGGDAAFPGEPPIARSCAEVYDPE